MLPKTLLDIVKFLQDYSLNLSKNSRDGRINSAFNEDEIVNILENNFLINRPKMRDWIDFSFESKGVFYPVNIKVSTMKTADNLNCKLGIYYALTGNIPTFNNGIAWDNYFKMLSDNLKENNADYYFLIINKNNPKDIFANSLKGLEVLVPNGNNLPFQAKWDNNRTFTPKSFELAKNFLLNAFEESLKLRADAYFSFKKYFYES